MRKEEGRQKKGKYRDRLDMRKGEEKQRKWRTEETKEGNVEGKKQDETKT